MVFLVIFFPQNTGTISPFEIIVYSLFWRIPACILILLLLDKKPVFRLKKDFFVLAAAFGALCLAGILVSLAAAITGFLPPAEIQAPSGITGWTAAILFSLCIGFLEEIYFRIYLVQKIIEINPEQTRFSIASAYFISSLIFALCHFYEGPWGIINALLAALVLSAAYHKSSSFFGIAAAHGLYNVFVFLSARGAS